MPGLLPGVDPDGLVEYSVVYTDRAVNHMSGTFQHVMRDIDSTLRSVYNAQASIIVPGSGTFGMESVARQFANHQHSVILRNGWFSYRWTQILEMGSIGTSSSVLKARRGTDGAQEPFAPAPLDEVLATITAEQPGVVFAPHVETSAGMMLPDDYLAAVAEATHAVGGLFVLDCIASGTIWVDMEALGIDVLCSAPQKGWSGPPCAGLVMLSARALDRLGETRSTSFAANLAQWHQIMQAYVGGGHGYHATMPTDSLRVFRDVMLETATYGFDQVKADQTELGRRVREVLAARGYPSVAADGFGAPGVVVSYTTDPDIKNGSKFSAAGMQIAAGVPLQCDEGDDFSTFRLGLFGLDKLQNIDRTVTTLEAALDTLN